MSVEGLLFIVSNVAIVLIAAAFVIYRRTRTDIRNSARLDALRKAGFTDPPTLHPVIDPTLCIGSGSCTVVCPQGFDVLGMLSGKATLLDPNACIGHGLCAVECPTSAIRLVFGTSERGVDIPHVKETFETNVPGIFITGELGGMGLIATAVEQTLGAMKHIQNRVNQVADLGADCADIVIVGAGPAGLAAALYCIENNMSYRLLDRETLLGGAILHYPRRKLVITVPVKMPLVGTIHEQEMPKEALLDLWHEIVKEHGIKLEGGNLVDDVLNNGDGSFSVVCGEKKIQGRSVLLGLGRRGIPRKLGVPGEKSSKVAYSLLEPEAYAKRIILVVGGGDSAIEAACTLAEEVEAIVTLSYRRGAFTRAKQKNLNRVDALVKVDRLKVIYNSNLIRIDEKSVVLKVDGEEQTLENEDVFIFAGGELPVGLLKRAGVSMEREYGEESEGDLQADDSKMVFGRIRQQAKSKGLKNHPIEVLSTSNAFSITLFAIGMLIVFALMWIGGDYYFASDAVRESQPALEHLAPTGIWGQTIGVIALFFMIANFVYFIRKEFAFMKGMGNIHSWMSFHVFSGLMSGIVVLFHSALFMKNLFAIVLYLSVAVVIATGLIGRYLYTFVPTDPRGRPLAHKALRTLSDRMAVEFGRHFDHLVDTGEICKIFESREEPPPSFYAVFSALIFVWPKRVFNVRRMMKEATRSIKSHKRKKEFKRFTKEMMRLRFQMDYLPHLKHLLGLWRLSHAVLAFLLIFLVAAHIAVEFWVGYRWIF